MHDHILIEDLAASPTQIWSRRIKQAAVIAPLAARARLTAVDVEEARKDLGISRRQFYQLVRMQRDRLAGAAPRGHYTGAHFHIDEQHEKIIGQAISDAGPAAREAEVYALAVQLSEQQGISPPSETSVRTRFGKYRPNLDLVGRLKLDCDYVADLCPLGLNLIDEGKAETGWFLAVVDSRLGKIVHHRLHAGLPSRADLLSMLAGAFTIEPRSRRKRSVGLTPPLLELGVLNLSLLNGVHTQAASSTRKLKGGSVIRAVCGRSIGRIPIRDEPSPRKDEGLPAVPHNIAEAVVSLIIEGMGSPTYSVAGSSNMVSASSTAWKTGEKI